MGKIDGNFIRGTVGPSVYKKYRNQQVVVGKSKKQQIDMTAATYDAAFVFGRASTFASYIRGCAEKVIGFYDGNMISRFAGECNFILQKAASNKGKQFNFSPEAFDRLNGFEFNRSSPVKNQLFVQPLTSFNGITLEINLPEIQIPRDFKFPANVKHCIFAINVDVFDLKNDLYNDLPPQSFEIEVSPTQNTVPAQHFSFETAAGCLCVVSIGLHYFEKTFAGNAVINNKSFSPSAILKAVFCPGEVVKQNWQPMTFNAKKKRKKSKPNEEGDQQAPT